jgi:hypothetical protein
MNINDAPSFYKLSDVPEFQRFQQVNPGKNLDEKQTALMFGRAIHWLAFFEIILPDFEKNDYYSMEVKTIVCNDPDDPFLPMEFYKHIAEMLKMYWTIKLEALYPQGDWVVAIHGDPEITVDATIRKR